MSDKKTVKFFAKVRISKYGLGLGLGEKEEEGGEDKLGAICWEGEAE